MTEYIVYNIITYCFYGNSIINCFAFSGWHFFFSAGRVLDSVLMPMWVKDELRPPRGVRGFLSPERDKYVYGLDEFWFPITLLDLCSFLLRFFFCEVL